MIYFFIFQMPKKIILFCPGIFSDPEEVIKSGLSV